MEHAELQLSAGGVHAAYFRVGGRTFDRQDPLGRLTFQGAQHLQTLGALTDYDRFKEDAERNWPWERWPGEHSRRRANLLRRDASRYRWFLEQVVVVREDEHTRLGYVTRVAEGGPNELALSIAFTEELPLPALLLSATDDISASLVVPPRTFNPGRMLRSMEAGPERKFRLTKIVQRGADFERVAFDES